MRNLVIAVLLVCLCFVCYQLAIVEDERYARQMGLCDPYTARMCPVARTSLLWDLYWGLRHKKPMAGGEA
ncbi:hypothetical protein GCM10007874_31430 [Labrys miyagiensis]|uniref:Uncharacterized protein n=1 Tax=Labrys miyagiensis TaxID=346912 RepID=A0ABQ6CIE4_9HYPH|nr:hypothetical protein GCM10007874_31430 [Labrys miyagiensis]